MHFLWLQLIFLFYFCHVYGILVNRKLNFFGGRSKCAFESCLLTNEKIRKLDFNICLSVQDMLGPIQQQSLTKDLNKVTNEVINLLIFNTPSERREFMKDIQNYSIGLKKKWGLNEDSQEILYLNSLRSILEYGIGVVDSFGVSSQYSKIRGTSDLNGNVFDKIELNSRILNDNYMSTLKKIGRICYHMLAS
jgi:hypothetical protein